MGIYLEIYGNKTLINPKRIKWKDGWHSVNYKRRRQLQQEIKKIIEYKNEARRIGKDYKKTKRSVYTDYLYL